MRRLLIRFIEKHHELDVMVEYVTLGKILARNRPKPIERVDCPDGNEYSHANQLSRQRNT